MKKLQELFKTMFDTEYAVADANHRFKFYVNNGIKEIERNYVFSADVTDEQTETTLTFNCYVEACEDNTGIGLTAYDSDRFFVDFKRIDF